jgi:putative tricarboxylic transport membrane protein
MFRRIKQFVGILFVVSSICVSMTYAASGPLAPTKGGYPSKPMTIFVPSSPGGGWDLTSRSIQHALASEKIMPTAVEVVNKPGAGGMIALAEFVQRKDPQTIMTTGAAMVTSIMINKSQYNFKNVTPLARLTSEHEVIAVSANSKYKDFKELLADFKKNPKSITWGGGAPGSLDHALVSMIALVVGVDIKNVNYVAFSGSDALPVVISNQVTVGVSGYSEYKPHVDAGKLRFLAYSTEKRLANDPTPTLKDFGLDVVVGNWRGVVGAPGINADSQAWLVEALTRMRSSKAWEDILAKQGWNDVFLTGDAFTKFLDREMESFSKVLKATGIIQ